MKHNFKFIDKLTVRFIGDTDELEYVVTPNGLYDIIFVYSNLDYKDGYVTADMKILSSLLSDSGDKAVITLHDDIIYEELDSTDITKRLCDACLVEVFNYLVGEHGL